VAAIQRRWGEQALRRLGSQMDKSFPHISTGFSDLDEALGIGGLARGRLHELLGSATSGKTSLALRLLARAQSHSRFVAYLDHGHVFDPDYAYRCGLDLSRLLVASPCQLEEALAMTEALVGGYGLTAMVLDGFDAALQEAQSAQLLAACLNRLVAPLSRSGMVLLFLHASMATGSPALSALAHHATTRLYVARERWVHHYGDIKGYQIRVEVRKNRLGPSGRLARADILSAEVVPGEVQFSGV